MSESVEELFQDGIRRYENGESAAELIPLFEGLTKQSPKTAAIQTCLAWLYLLEGQADKAHKAATTATKLDPADAQARVNLTLAMLELKKTGVRQQVEWAQKIMVADDEQIDGVKANLQEGMKRRQDWPYPARVWQWLFE